MISGQWDDYALMAKGMGGDLMAKKGWRLCLTGPSLLHSCIFLDRIRRFLTFFALGIDKTDNIVQNDYMVVIKSKGGKILCQDY